MALVVYCLCAFTSLTCAFLLLRGYSRSKVRLLLWTGLCFVGLTLHNFLLIIDVHVFPESNMILLRNAPALAGILVLLAGTIWDSL